MCDYYQILGVEPDSDLNTIKKAYWKRAMECHPDRGGTHEQMLQINEAFQILSNPSARSHYDAIRTNTASQQTRETSEADVHQARQQAQEYPHDWAGFETWWNAISKDIANAEYGEWRGLPLWSIPTAGKSVSGWLFIIGGAVLGFIVCGCIFAGMPDNNGNNIGALGIGLVAGGGWIGKKLHELLRKNVQPTAQQHTSQNSGGTIEPETLTVNCPKCSQKLRVPVTHNQLRLRCRTCGHEFVHSP
ncbi:MAG: J domain-containing protein [Verrucomicrobiota bacterium]|jgi:ribosomal protein S27E